MIVTPRRNAVCDALGILETYIGKSSALAVSDRSNGYAGSISSLNDDGRDDKLSPSLARMKQLSASRSSIASSRFVPPAKVTTPANASPGVLMS